MRTDAQVSLAKTQVRSVLLARHVVGNIEDGRAYAISMGLSHLPRLWAYATRAVLAGFAEGLAHSKGKHPEERIALALSLARAQLAARSDALIERAPSDATLIGVLLDHGELHVVSAGPGRVYLHRRGDARRLTPRDDFPGGLLRAQPVRASEALEPGDLILAGTVSAFSVRAIGRVASALEADPLSPTSVIASLLTEPASEAGVGAAALAARVQ